MVKRLEAQESGESEAKVQDSHWYAVKSELPTGISLTSRRWGRKAKFTLSGKRWCGDELMDSHSTLRFPVIGKSYLKNHLKKGEGTMKKEELVQIFGKGLLNVEGFVDFLTSQSSSISDAKAKEGVGAYILDKHWWSSGGGGIGMAAIVGVYRDGHNSSRTFIYRDQYDAKKDDWNYAYKRIGITNVDTKKIEVTVKSNSYTSSYSFDLAAKPKPTAQKPMVSKKEKEEFESHAKAEMERVAKDNQHNHPLFKEQTGLREHIIDYVSKVAAFILFEQIDTDRCTMEGSGWCGDQFRYSIWIINGNNRADRVHEDHAYNKDRGCDIRGLRIFDGKVFATNWKGEEITIAV